MDTGSFMRDLAVILTAVGLASAVCARFGWPKVLGYIVAGVALGQHTFGGSWFINEASIDVLGQIGVVFLMLTLGLEFSVRKLSKVGHVAFPTAVLDMAVMIWMGHFVGTRLLGLSTVQGLFLGAAISDSATTLLAKTINDMGWGGRRFSRYIFGITITEDVLCIGVIALLTGIVRNGNVSLIDAMRGLGGLLLFMCGVTVLGLLFVPKILNRIARMRDDESLLLAILGFCFMVSFIALKLNYSLALGAFMVGVMGAESEPLRRVYQLCLPLRTMFSAIFFVTIGLLFDPLAMLQQWPAIMLITLLVIVGKTINCTLGSLLTGQDLKNAIQTGVGLGQIGEFAYLVALIGISMKAVDNSIYQITVGVSILTTVLNPMLLRLSDPFASWVVRVLPRSWAGYLDTYGKWYDRFRHTSMPSKAVRSLRFNLFMSALLLAVVAVIYIAAGMLAGLNFSGLSPVVENYKTALLWGVASLLAVPCAILIFFRARALGKSAADILIPDKAENTEWAISFRRITGLLCAVTGVVLLFFESVMLSGSIMPDQIWVRVAMGAIMLSVGVVGARRFRQIGQDAVQTLRAVVSEKVEVVANETTAELLDIHTERVTITGSSAVTAMSLRDIGLRARAGVSVLCIERAGRAMVNPSADDKLCAGDVLLLLGDDKQIARARAILY